MGLCSMPEGSVYVGCLGGQVGVMEKVGREWYSPLLIRGRSFGLNWFIKSKLIF